MKDATSITVTGVLGLSLLSLVVWYAPLWLRVLLLLSVVSALVHTIVAAAFRQRDKAARWAKFEQHVDREKEKKRQQQTRTFQMQPSEGHQQPSQQTQHVDTQSQRGSEIRSAAARSRDAADSAADNIQQQSDAALSGDSDSEHSEPPSPKAGSAASPRRRAELQNGYLIF